MGIVRNNALEMYKSGHPMDQAWAAAYANARRHPAAYGGGIRGYQDGGLATTALGQPSGIAPTTATMNPLQQQQLQRYASMSPEQLQELAVALGPTQQGQMVQRVLQQKRFMPQTPTQPQASSVAPQQPIMRRGGNIPHMQGGGSPLGVSMGMADPPWERSQMRGQPSTGFLLGATPGRADLVKAQPPAGSYVWPADVIAGLGEGNGLAGANILQKALAIGPKGTPLPAGRRGSGPPRAPAPFTGSYMAPPAASGGRTGEPTDIMAAHGEVITPPHVVQMWGRGNMKRGHDLFDKAVLHFRQKHIQDLKGLKPPKKS